MTNKENDAEKSSPEDGEDGEDTGATRPEWTRFDPAAGEAVRRATDPSDRPDHSLVLLTGPPGSGKTTSIGQAALTAGMKTLIVAQDLETAQEYAENLKRRAGLPDARTLVIKGRRHMCMSPSLVEGAQPHSALCKWCPFRDHPYSKNGVYTVVAQLLAEKGDLSSEAIIQAGIDNKICPYLLQFHLAPHAQLVATTYHLYLREETHLDSAQTHFDLKVLSEADVIPRILYDIENPRIVLKEAIDDLSKLIHDATPRFERENPGSTALHTVETAVEIMEKWQQDLAETEDKQANREQEAENQEDDQPWKPLEDLEKLSKDQLEDALKEIAEMLPEHRGTIQLAEVVELFETALDTKTIQPDYSTTSLKYEADPDSVRAVRAIRRTDIKTRLQKKLEGPTIMETATPLSLTRFLDKYRVCYATIHTRSRNLAKLNKEIDPSRRFSKRFLLSDASVREILTALRVFLSSLPRRLPRGKRRVVVLVFPYKDAAVVFLREASQLTLFDRWRLYTLSPLKDGKGIDIRTYTRVEERTPEQIERRCRSGRGGRAGIIVDWVGSDHSRSTNRLGFAAGSIFIGRQRASPNSRKAYGEWMNNGLMLAGFPTVSEDWVAHWLYTASLEGVVQHVFRFHRRDDSATRILLLDKDYHTAPDVVPYFSFSDAHRLHLPPESYEEPSPSNREAILQAVLEAMQSRRIGYVSQVCDWLLADRGLQLSPITVSKALKQHAEAGRLRSFWLGGLHFYYHPPLSEEEARQTANSIRLAWLEIRTASRHKGLTLEWTTRRAIRPLYQAGWTDLPRHRYPDPDFAVRRGDATVFLECKNTVLDAPRLIQVVHRKFLPAAALPELAGVRRIHMVIVAADATPGALRAASELGVVVVVLGFKPLVPAMYSRLRPALSRLGKVMEKPLTDGMLRFTVDHIRSSINRIVDYPGLLPLR